MMRRILPFLLAAVFLAFAQKYTGPTPSKPDVPYLKHASDLVATEAVTAKEEKKKEESTYIIEGANSSVKTPLASPIFLIQADKINPDRLGLYKLESKSGHREIVFGPKRQPKPIRIEVSRLGGNVYRIEVDDSLEPGEYSLSPEGSNQVFCFQVF
ncbi:MAG TPA: hypothetical protein VE959_23510 [Bryobacteraceae bacterium]|nr:hypothetical protein [Bryobacteraceae bacterium]